MRIEEPARATTNRRITLARAAAHRLLVSALVLIPCFWQARMQDGLSSHLYNAWLVQLIQAGHAPGLSLASQHTNVLFDLTLSCSLALLRARCRRADRSRHLRAHLLLGRVCFRLRALRPGGPGICSACSPHSPMDGSSTSESSTSTFPPGFWFGSFPLPDRFRTRPPARRSCLVRARLDRPRLARRHGDFPARLPSPLPAPRPPRTPPPADLHPGHPGRRRAPAGGALSVQLVRRPVALRHRYGPVFSLLQHQVPAPPTAPAPPCGLLA